MSVPPSAPFALSALPHWRFYLVVSLIAAATYANALGNGWALDDEQIIATNPVVTEARWGEAIGGPYWTRLEAAPALWRPTTLAALAAQWRVFGDRPAAFHAVSLVLHVLVSVLVAALLVQLLPAAAAAVGAALFAAHPVHVEAVANVVGQSELLAASCYLAACVLYLRTRGDDRQRLFALGAIAMLYALAVGAKESAITLPAALLLLALVAPERGGGRSAAERSPRGLAAELPLFGVLAAVGIAYLVVRTWVLGSIAGENVPAELRSLSTGARLLTALSLWPTYLRLLLFPLDLSADYGPGVLVPATGLRAGVVLGALLLAALGAVGALARRRAAWATLAAGWLVLTLLPVSHLFFPAGTLLAERTLYLPSVAVAMAAAGAFALVGAARPERMRLAWAAVGVVVAAFCVRSVARNPSWLDSFSVMSALAADHPESWRAHRSRAAGLVRAGDVPAALAEYERALALLPGDYVLLCEAGSLYKRQRDLARAERLLAAAVGIAPDRPIAYRLLAELYLLAGDGRRAHGTALAGLARWGADRELWALVSESYVAKGDLAAAVRAREAALGADPSSTGDRARLAQLLEAQSRTPAPGSGR